MKQFPRSLLLAMLALIPLCNHAESFMGITVRSRMTDVQKLFPNAVFRDSKPTWLQPHQRFVEITGPGLDGTLAVKLEHEVDGTRVLAKELAMLQTSRTLEPWQASLLFYLPSKLAKLEETPPTDPWEVIDIRWAPPTPIPIRSAHAKYGTPDSDTMDEQFRRTLKWTSRGVTAYVDQNDLITLLLFTFTVRDHVCSGPDAPLEICKAFDAAAKTEAPPKPSGKK